MTEVRVTIVDKRGDEWESGWEDIGLATIGQVKGAVEEVLGSSAGGYLTITDPHGTIRIFPSRDVARVDIDSRREPSTTEETQ